MCVCVCVCVCVLQRVCKLVSAHSGRLGSDLILGTVLDFVFYTSCYAVGKFLMTDFVAEEDKLFIDLSPTTQFLPTGVPKNQSHHMRVCNYGQHLQLDCSCICVYVCMCLCVCVCGGGGEGGGGAEWATGWTREGKKIE